MIKMQTKVNEVGLLEIPDLMCEELGLKENSQLMIYTRYGTAFLQNGNRVFGAITCVLDELNRVMIPTAIRKAAKIKKNSKVIICLNNDKLHIELWA